MSYLRALVVEYNKEVKEALSTIFGELNHGQQKKLLRNAKVRALFDRYGIEYNAD